MGKLTRERALALFEYDQENGVLYWRERPLSDFKSMRACAAWNGKLKGKSAGSNNGGYLAIGIDGKYYKAHRVIWLIETGAWPSEEIDHEDGDKANNRFSNLVDGTHASNMKNKARPKTNKSGHPGVMFEEKRGLWVARIPVDGKLKTLGRSKEKAKVVALRKAAEVRYGYSEIHGRAA